MAFGIPHIFDTLECPYIFCGATPGAIPVVTTPHAQHTGEGTNGMLVRDHLIDHPILKGGCPASLMHWPLSMASQQALRERIGVDSKYISEHMMDGQNKPPTLVSETPESTSLRGKHRLGREPEPNSDDWVLGGRIDNDVFIPERKVNPDNIGGHVLGRGRAADMASIEEMVGALSEANMRAGEAQAVMAQEKENLVAAVNAANEAYKLAASIGADSSDTVLSAMARFSAAEAKARQMLDICDEVIQILEAGVEHTTAYIGRLNS